MDSHLTSSATGLFAEHAAPSLFALFVIAILTFILILPPSAAAASVPLTPGAELSLPSCEILWAGNGGVRLVFELPAVDIEPYNLDGEIFQTIAIPGAELQGIPGEPALPEFTRLVALPNGSGYTLRVIASEEQTLDGMRILPMQEVEGDDFTFDRNIYAENDFLGGERVTLGEPSVFRDLRVVPITFRPVSFNPVTGEVRIAHRIEVEVDFAGVDLRAACSRARIAPTPGFERMFRSTVLNYGYEPDHPRSDAPNLGTWVCIAPNNATVLEKLAPLVAWRQRMGYNAILANTSETGSTASAIKAWLENAYETWEYPPEYVTIVGDANGTVAIGTFYDPYSGCSGEGDHPYVQLDGTDVWPDAFIGRLSVESTSRLELVVNKIVGYESTPLMSPTNWFTHACLVGDPYDSGISCLQIQQWLKERLDDVGYTTIDTVFTAPFESQIRTSLNQGATYFGYRGFWGMSGWDSGDIGALTNGWKLIYAINLTCGTGSFASGTSTNETWLRGGVAPNTPTAGIGAIATATECTHTKYNNSYYAGAAYGVFWDDRFQLGPSNARGKVEMLLNYEGTEFYQAAGYLWWNNLMGDPATEIWTGVPEILTVTHPETVPIGTNVVPITVRDTHGAPVEGAWVHLFKSGSISTGAPTNSAGEVSLPLEAGVQGTVLVTVTGHNLHPYRNNFTVAQQADFIGLDGWDVDDDLWGASSGNGDGVANPGETIELNIDLRNFGTEPQDNVTLRVGTADPYVGLLTLSPLQYGTIAPGAVGVAPAPVVFRLDAGCPPDHDVTFDLTVTSGTNAWESRLELPLDGASLTLREIQLADVGDGVLDPGETGRMVTVLQNNSSYNAYGPIALQLISDSYSVHVIDSQGSIPSTILPGNWSGNWDDRFQVSSPSDCIPGLPAHLRVVATFPNGSRITIPVTLTVGTPASHDPTGPDAHGYLAYDQTDTGYPERPAYSWVEINPYSGGQGTAVGLTDFGWQQDDSQTIDLPFPFVYYGQTFTRVTICSNGWLALGRTNTSNFRNWNLPSAEGAANMVAPFWDDLYQSGNGRVYRWYDANNHRFIVAWDGVLNVYSGSPESFEVILYDPVYHPTQTGDGEIVFQYETVNNNDYEEQYSTVGIQDELHSTGIAFNYHNTRPATAAPLAAGLAVKFTTGCPGVSDAPGGDPLEARTFLLLQNEPNPMRGQTTLAFTLDRSRNVNLRIFDVNGHLVRSLLDGTLTPGPHAVSWTGLDDSGRAAPAGLYFFRLDSEEDSQARKLLLLR